MARGLDLDWVLKLYQPLLWPDIVFYFSVSPVTSSRRVAATRTPNYYEAGQDVTVVDDPAESYQRFITRVIREYESLALIFNFITVDAEQSIGEQHHQIRELFREGEQRPWSEWNADAVAEWLALDGARRVKRAAGDGRLDRGRRRERRRVAARRRRRAARSAPRRARARAAASAAGTHRGSSRNSPSPTRTPGAVGADAAAALRRRSRVPAALGDSSRARRGPLVVAAPYVDTAVAFGRAAGIETAG